MIVRRVVILARLAALASALALGACTTQPPAPPAAPAQPVQAVPITPPADVPGAPVARVPVPEAVPLPPPSPPAGTPLATAPLSFPPNVQYLCVSDKGGARQQTAIEFSPKVRELCRKHPEMGPCQYERDMCRRAGGRVFASNGAEITLATEAEYDKKVLRVRFRAD